MKLQNGARAFKANMHKYTTTYLALAFAAKTAEGHPSAVFSYLDSKSVFIPHFGRQLLHDQCLPVFFADPSNFVCIDIYAGP